MWGGDFIHLKHYDPDDEEDLLNKYFPKKLKTKKSKLGGGKAKPKGKREKETLQQQSEPEDEAQCVQASPQPETSMKPARSPRRWKPIPEEMDDRCKT